LPVNYGDNQQKKVSQQVKSKESGQNFNDVLDEAVSSGEQKPVKSERKKGEEKISSETSSISSDDVTGRPEAVETDEDRRPDSGTTGVEADAGKKSKKSTTAKEVGRKTGDAEAKTEFPDKKNEEDLAAVLAGLAGGEKTEPLRSMKSGKKVVDSESAAKVLKLDTSEVLNSQAGAFKIIGSGLEAKHAGGGKKGLRPSSAEGKFSLEASEVLLRSTITAKGGKVHSSSIGQAGGKTTADDKVLTSKKQDKRASSKLRVVDHRAQSGRQAEGQRFKVTSEDSLKNPAVVSDDSGKIIELNAAPDSARTEIRSSDFRVQQSAVLSQLKEEVNSQIVKQAGIVVKANGSGEIKLVMRPEQLGKVRIQLSLNDNHIAGRIIVENNIVREIFESNLENLYKAFGSEGFENGGLEVTVEGGDAGDTGRRSPGGPGRRAVQAIEDAVPELVDTEWQSNAVNMVV